MKILVANLGSTSFKYRLFDMNGEKELRAAASSASAPSRASAFSKPAAGARNKTSRPRITWSRYDSAWKNLPRMVA